VIAQWRRGTTRTCRTAADLFEDAPERSPQNIAFIVTRQNYGFERLQTKDKPRNLKISAEASAIDAR
jgi:hypothetical protein